MKKFQLTSSQGGWRVGKMYVMIQKRHFNSYPHKEDDMQMGQLPIGVAIFQLTSSQGGWLTWVILKKIMIYFNSHPHKEDDRAERSEPQAHTYFNSHPHKEDDFIFPQYFHIFNIFQLTSSQGGWPSTTGKMIFYVVFQLTSSQGGWRFWISSID